MTCFWMGFGWAGRSISIRRRSGNENFTSDLEKEPLRLLVNMATGPWLGIYDVFLDGIRVGGPFDFYSAEIGQREFHFRSGKGALAAAGEHGDWAVAGYL